MTRPNDRGAVGSRPLIGASDTALIPAAAGTTAATDAVTGAAVADCDANAGADTGADTGATDDAGEGAGAKDVAHTDADDGGRCAEGAAVLDIVSRPLLHHA